jgi:hypothetical protein
VVAGDTKAIADEFVLVLLPGGPGWRIKLVSRDPAAPAMQIVMTGCGATLQAFEIEQARGVRRILTFERRP